MGRGRTVLESPLCAHVYYVDVGHLQMAHVTPQVISDGARRRHLELAFDAFAAGEQPAKCAVRKRPAASLPCPTTRIATAWISLTVVRAVLAGLVLHIIGPQPSFAWHEGLVRQVSEDE